MFWLETVIVQLSLISAVVAGPEACFQEFISTTSPVKRNWTDPGAWTVPVTPSLYDAAHLQGSKIDAQGNTRVRTLSMQNSLLTVSGSLIIARSGCRLDNFTADPAIMQPAFHSFHELYNNASFSFSFNLPEVPLASSVWLHLRALAPANSTTINVATGVQGSQSVFLSLPGLSLSYGVPYNLTLEYRDHLANAPASFNVVNVTFGCSSGSYYSGVDCQLCQAGYYCRRGSVSALENPCGFGAWCPQGSSQPQVCPAGTFGSSATLTTAACSGLCSANHWCPAGSTSSTQNICPLNTTSTPGSGAAWHCLCAPGFARVAGLDCQACPLGTVKEVPGNSSCSGCNAGKYAASTVLCQDCNPGYFCTASSGSATQNECGNGHYCPAGSPQPLNCPAGTFGSSTTLTTATCSGLCAANHWCAPGSTSAAQNPCPANSLASAGSQSRSDCVCSAGFEPTQGSCTACTQGKSKKEPGNTPCEEASGSDDDRTIIIASVVGGSAVLIIASVLVCWGRKMACFASRSPSSGYGPAKVLADFDRLRNNQASSAAGVEVAIIPDVRE